MDASSITRYLTETFPDIQVETSDESSFFFCGEERKFPFATLVTKDSYDTVSNLNRPGVFRLNIGLARATFLSFFGAQPARPGEADAGPADCDFTALDRLMPHPVYGSMFWACVLNPSASTFEEKVRPLLAEAYEQASGRHSGRSSGKQD